MPGLLGRRLTLAIVLLGAFARPASAPWPTVMMFHGGALKAPVFVTGADTPPFGAPSGSMVRSTATAKDMGDRPFVNVAYFWGPKDDPANNGTALPDLKPEMTWQHGRFYPAAGDKPAMLFVTGSLLNKQMAMPFMVKGGSRLTTIPADPAAFTEGREVPVSALAVLKRLGVIK